MKEPEKAKSIFAFLRNEGNHLLELEDIVGVVSHIDQTQENVFMCLYLHIFLKLPQLLSTLYYV